MIDSRPILVWDMDDVLNRLMKIWLDTAGRGLASVKNYGELTASPSDRLLGISRAKYLASLRFPAPRNVSGVAGRIGFLMKPRRRTAGEGKDK